MRTRIFEKNGSKDNVIVTVDDGRDTPSTDTGPDKTHRKLKVSSILCAIGTALFVQIGTALTKGGPGSLFLAFTIWCSFIIAINNCLAEMVTWMPISSPFVRFADHFVDPAFGFCTGFNYFIFEVALVTFEIVAVNVVIKFWSDHIPVAVVIVVVLVCYACLNFFAVRYYGESEFWLAIGKVTLATGLIIFTFITMVGGNPLRDVYGFRYWNPARVPGAPFAEYIETGSLGRFLGFLACLIQAAFTMAGPEYVSMTAGEAEMPRRTLPPAFRSVIYRLTIFFVVGSLCVGVVVPYSDPDLVHAISNARPGAGASPYVIAMDHLHIPILPHFVNALVLTAVFSAGNSYAYCASRTLYGLALEGKMPRVLTKCTRLGVPVYCVGLTLGISLLSFLQVSNGTAVVLQWFVNLATASQLLNFATICYSYIRFYQALKAQGIDRNTLPYKSKWQPFCGYYGCCGSIVMALVGGYTVFLPGRWDVPTFFFSYTMIGVLPVLFVFWKVFKKTEWRKLEEIDFFEAERLRVDEYEQASRASI
ncbi:hypothetical protein AMATHDRAFT_74783 [Amanita thiersii Skay4041]|uniref:Amino acid permease/ SLC12A domain-containing protein n=1 Tax=Amanita thiersii Skay4041 TaxID=703135 RepID=A0A2A9NR05_9AGAR|nr:hypothetical protein AMATHDRAFT_74783 [Amanita thiersii Skay4041]